MALFSLPFYSRFWLPFLYPCPSLFSLEGKHLMLFFVQVLPLVYPVFKRKKYAISFVSQPRASISVSQTISLFYT